MADLYITSQAPHEDTKLPPNILLQVLTCTVTKGKQCPDSFLTIDTNTVLNYSIKVLHSRLPPKQTNFQICIIVT